MSAYIIVSYHEYSKRFIFKLLLCCRSCAVRLHFVQTAVKLLIIKRIFILMCFSETYFINTFDLNWAISILYYDFINLIATQRPAPTPFFSHRLKFTLTQKGNTLIFKFSLLQTDPLIVIRSHSCFVHNKSLRNWVFICIFSLKYSPKKFR